MHFDDHAEINATDSKGWLMSKQLRTSEFADSTGYSLFLVYETPANEPDSSLLTVTVNSLNHPGETASDSFTLFSYLPEATRIIIMPDSVAVATADTLLFDATIFDQNGRILEVDVDWEADAGYFLADQPGVFKVPEAAGIVSITATISTNKLSASAHIRVWEEQIPIEQIIIRPDEVYLLPQKTERFSSLFLDPEGFLFLPGTNAIWTATGGEIDMFGLYVAGLLTGTFEVSLADTLQDVSASVAVYIVDELPVPIPPESPDLVSPADGSEGLQAPVTLIWTNVVKADYYILEIAFDEGFDEMFVYIGLSESQYVLNAFNPLTAHYWRVRAASSAGNSAFSATWSFTSGDDEAPGVPETLHATGAVSGDAEECFNALQTITVENFVVAPGGVATLIAGENIVILPGTHVQQGSWMHAYIAPDGPFCEQFEKHFLAADETGAEEIESIIQPTHSQPVADDASETDHYDQVHELDFKVYPNPGRHVFMLEFSNPVGEKEFTVEVFNIYGTIVKRNNMQYTFSLEGHKPGIYLVRVVQDGKARTVRLLKY